MDTSSESKELLETKDKESAINNAENTSFILGSGKLVTPQKHEAEVTANLCRPDIFKSPLNFSTVTVEQLGITPESFVKNTPGKPSSYLKKSRRRSTIGARGSPETNHLICFIAQQRNLKNAQKSPLAQKSPFQGSPVLYRNVNSLREQISAFQTAFYSIKENEKMADCPEFSKAEREFETTDFIKKEGVSEWQRSGFSAKLPSKRRRIAYQSDFNGDLTDAEKKGINLQLLNTDTPGTDRTCAVETSPANLSEKSSGPGLTQSGWLVEESILLSDLAETSSGIKVADCVEGKGSSDAVSQKNRLEDKLTEAAGIGTVPDIRSPVTSVSKKDIAPPETFVLRSVLKKPSVKLFPESLQEHCDNLCDDGTHPSLISNLGNCCKEQKAEDQENRKVPAFLNVRKRKRVTFGEDLSPEVFDESLPANTPLRKGETPVRKKDLSSTSPLRHEHSPVPEQLSQPNFDDKGENLYLVYLKDEASYHFLLAILILLVPYSSGTDTFSSSNNQENMSSHQVGRITRTSNRRNVNLVEDKASKMYMELLHLSQLQCFNAFSQVLKSGRKKKGKGKQRVKKSLYGEREIASKKPLLSPIPEIPEISEMTPSVPGIWRMYSDNFNSNGKPEEVLKPPKNLTKRKTLLPQIPEDLHINQSSDKCNVSEFCSSSLLGNATFDQDSNINTIEVNENIPKAENKVEGENELKTGAGNENSHISCVSVTEEYILSDHPKPDSILQSQEFSAAGQNVENLCRVFKISEDISIKCEKQDDLSLAVEGKPKSSALMSNSQKEDVFIENIKETNSQCENLERKSTENSSEVTCKERKHRRRSMCYPDGQSLPLEKSGNHKNANRVSSSGEIDLENSELYKDLSDAIEQTFKRTNNETKVRRSTRLQKDLENEGLIWISLPFPSTSCTSQKTKRRTICTFDSRGFERLSSRKETMSSRQIPGMPSSSGKEHSEDPAANSANLLGKRRMSFCTSTLSNTKNTTQLEDYRRRSFLNQKEKTL
ncbi:cell division cycle-associated protein 2 [Trichechus manatus latirostris]|uniref:Cell division cycle-associated protein 2 n=1 Tax=Trichechus manatus latirostris TaxID=127582 RepID=A0A2Y9RDP8_TRIMA|nr:cell division cycle-associated protein 2 [Trichechus manatus latirostris]